MYNLAIFTPTYTHSPNPKPVPPTLLPYPPTDGRLYNIYCKNKQTLKT